MQERRQCSNQSAPTFLALVLSGIGLGFISLYFSAGRYGLSLFSFYLRQPLTVAVNLLPFLLLNLLLFFLTNRLWIAFAADSILCFLFSWANYWKLLSRDAPLIASDLLIVSEALDMSRRYIRFTPFMALSVVLALTVTVWFALRFHGRIRSWKIRVICVTVLVLVCVLILFGGYLSDDVYSGLPVWPELPEWFETAAQISRGGIYPFLCSIPNAVPAPPAGYEEDQAKEMIAPYASDPIPQDRRVSVIFVMLEAFADLTDLTDAITGEDPYGLYHRLQEESYCGNLVVNAFAGGTNNTERSVLTGFPYLSAFHIPSWSYARYFQEQGYEITGAHAGYQGFYSRNLVNWNLGFPDYRFIDNYYSLLPEDALVSWELLDPETAYYLDNLYDDMIPMDFQFLPEITRHSKQRMESGKSVFSFNVTYQNHGPYPGDIGLFSREYVPRGDLSQGDYNIVNNYLAGIEETGKRVYEMADAFRHEEEPVVLVFFGDHMPWLGDQNSTYHALGIDISSDTDSSFLNYYSTDYLIWANDAAKQMLRKSFVGTGPTVSPIFLMNVLFEQCGWSGPAYRKLSDAVMDAVPILHQTGVYASGGSLVPGSELSSEQASLLHKLNCVRYYYTNKYMLE